MIVYICITKKINNMWIQSVFNAISEVESEYPGLATKVANLDPNQEWTQEDWEDYNKVAAAIVEPFAFPGGESEDEEWYYETSERNGSGFVKANIGDVENSESWRKICDIIDIQGY
jgi:hypothetical protein